MPAPLWWARLNSSSPRYAEWKHILGGDDVPLKSPRSFEATTEDGQHFDAYSLDVDKLIIEQRIRLLKHVAEKFGVDLAEVARAISRHGFFPIREADVTIAFSMRAFI